MGLRLSCFVFLIMLPVFSSATPLFEQAIHATALITKNTGQKNNALKGVPRKPVVLMQAQHQLSKQQWQRRMLTVGTTESTVGSSHLPRRVVVGMNNVPVLDQGMHGTCVMFANTAVMDAILGRGDDISQLCALELNSYLNDDDEFPTGWNGSMGRFVLSNLLEFGVVSKVTEHTQSCAGLTSYPLMEESNTGHALSLDEYKRIRRMVTREIFWYPLVDDFEFMLTLESEQAAAGLMELADKALFKVKQALARSKPSAIMLVTFGIDLPYDQCNVGACATYHKKMDTWVLSDEIRQNDFAVGGHEMIITGYDDDAVAIDNQGKKHTGLLTIRNSYGDAIGDNGDFYMSYDFFKVFYTEVQAVGSTRLLG